MILTQHEAEMSSLPRKNIAIKGTQVQVLSFKVAGVSQRFRFYILICLYNEFST